MSPSVLAAIVIAAALAGPGAGQGPPAMPVRVDAVKLEAVQDQRLVTGDLRAVRRAQIATREPGIVLEVKVDEGHRVRKGDILAELDRARLDVELKQIEALEAEAEAQLEQRRIEAAWRKLDLDNLLRAQAGSAANPKEMYDAQNELLIAEARITAAQRLLASFEARQALLRQRLDDMSIAAPFDAVVVSRLVEIGEWAAEGDALVELVSSGPVEAWLNVPQQNADAILGKSFASTITIDATGASFTADQFRFIPLVDPKARSFSIVTTLGNADETLAPGMSLTAWVPTGDRADRLTVHKDAIMRNETGAFVYVVRGGSGNGPAAAVAAPMDVQVLFSIGQRVAIRSNGLADSDQVVVEGNERLSAMGAVIPQVTAQPPQGSDERAGSNAQAPGRTGENPAGANGS